MIKNKDSEFFFSLNQIDRPEIDDIRRVSLPHRQRNVLNVAVFPFRIEALAVLLSPLSPIDIGLPHFAIIRKWR